MSTRVAIAVGFALGISALGTLLYRLEDSGRLPQLSLAKGALKGVVPEKLRYTWTLHKERHWQIASTPSESREVTDQHENNRGSCGPGMVEVKGRMKVDTTTNPFDPNTIEELQKSTCKRWINRNYPERCAEFDRDKWLAISKEMPTKEMSFCMDRFEYPNQKGAYPWIMVSWYEANELCAEEGKRLCNEAEWTFACEGEEATPYPYGYVRDADACIVDQKWRAFHEPAFQPRGDYEAMAEMDRLWQGVPSGSQPRCRSPFGVYDMTGNVDEWTRTVREGERPSILKGGYWGPVRTRCRPSTRSHDENHTFYQQGFRCCTDPGASTTQRASTWHDPATAPHPRELK